MGTKAILLGLLITVTCLTPSPGPAQSRPRQKDPSPLYQQEPSPFPAPRVVRNERAIQQADFAKAKSDATELAALAKELREELDKPRVDTLSPEVVSRAQQIGKLAKKIREETRTN